MTIFFSVFFQLLPLPQPPAFLVASFWSNFCGRRHQNQRFDIYLDVLIFRDDCFQLFKWFQLFFKLTLPKAIWAFAITWHPSSVNFSHFNLLIWNPSAKWTETWSVCEIILDRRPTSSWNCCGPVNSCGHRTAVSSRKSVCSPVLIIFYFNSDSWYKNFYTWFPATSQYDFRSMSLAFYFLKFFLLTIF